jgi:hypothetical protein
MFRWIRSPSLLLLLLLLGLALGAAACGSIRGGSRGGDDDDSQGDDDTSGDDDGDDDDTAPPDDDDATPPDDDDATPPDDDDDDDEPGYDIAAVGIGFETFTANSAAAGTGIEATFLFTYYADTEFQQVECEQRVEAEGTADFGFGVVSGCSNCTGLIVFDSGLVNDVSNPASNPDECDVAQLDAAQMNLAAALLTPQAGGGYGDFLTLALVDRDSFESAGLYTDDAETEDVSYWDTFFGDYALAFQGIGYIENAPGTLMEQLVANGSTIPNAGGSSDWYAWFIFYRDPASNSNEGMEMDGDYYALAYGLTFGG